jgi:hypothetical protein
MVKGQIFKNLEDQDFVITPFVTHKSWTFGPSDYQDYLDGGWGIQVASGIEGTSSMQTQAGDIVDEEVNADGTYMRTIYGLVNNLYYKYDEPFKHFGNWDTATTRSLDGKCWLFAIPQQMFGERIEPGTVELTFGGWDIQDDGFGNLKDVNNGDLQVGNVFYEQGSIIITETSSYYDDLNTGSGWTLSLKGKHTIREMEILASVEPGELEMTLNPSAYSCSFTSPSTFTGSGWLKDRILYEDTWGPYITAVGLYNDKYELLALGKLATPIQNKPDEAIYIIVRIDI